MKVKAFDRKKYYESVKTLESRKAPSYIMEAYHRGYTNVVNAYYREQLNKRFRRPTIINESRDIDYIKLAQEDIGNKIIQEALTEKNKDFIKLFYQMTNLDIVSGEKLPPSAGKSLKQATTKGLGVKSILKRMR